MKAQRKYQVISILNITVAYAIIGLLVPIYDNFLLRSQLSLGTVPGYSLRQGITYNLIGAVCAGVVFGFVLTTLNHRIRYRSFSYGQILGAICFLVIFSLVSFIGISIYTANAVGTDWSDPFVVQTFKTNLLSSVHLKNLLLWIIIFQLTQFYLQLDQKFGPGNLRKTFTGKYHTPKIEPRIFMFLDLKSSTSIAEKLGETRYHSFLQEVFSDITEPVNENKAEIYQYVGDEVIVSWHLEKVTNKENCIKIFFDIEREFKKRENNYLKKYGVVPIFKAGAHKGYSIVGEIGIIKRDITYSGDLLNTTARIQGKCNELNSLFLISGDLKEYLSKDLERYKVSSKGEITLRGKESLVQVYGVSQ